MSKLLTASEANALSPQEQRQRLSRSYLVQAELQCVKVDARELDQMVVAELELVDTERRAPPPAPDAKPSQPRPDVLAQAQAETGTRLHVGRTPETALPARTHRYQPKVLHKNPMLVGERWGAAIARVGRILEGAGGAATMGAAAANAAVPKLARAFHELYAFFLTRTMPPPVRVVDHNPFRGMSDKDAANAFMRKVEDLCDRSTGVLGSWYVK